MAKNQKHTKKLLKPFKKKAMRLGLTQKAAMKNLMRQQRNFMTQPKNAREKAEQLRKRKIIEMSFLKKLDVFLGKKKKPSKPSSMLQMSLKNWTTLNN